MKVTDYIAECEMHCRVLFVSKLSPNLGRCLVSFVIFIKTHFQTLTEICRNCVMQFNAENLYAQKVLGDRNMAVRPASCIPASKSDYVDAVRGIYDVRVLETSCPGSNVFGS